MILKGLFVSPSVKFLRNLTGDLSIVNSARVSYNKFSTEFDVTKDKKLIKFLSDWKHFTPFTHVRIGALRQLPKDTYINWVDRTNGSSFQRDIQKITDKDVTFYESGSIYGYLKQSNNPIILEHIKEICPHTFEVFNRTISKINTEHFTEIISYDELKKKSLKVCWASLLYQNIPIIVARQLFKSTVGISRNEISRRYVKTPPTFNEIVNLRKQHPSSKQGSLDENIDNYENTKKLMEHFQNLSVEVYNNLLEQNVCAEQARMILPQSLTTSYYETADVYAICRMIYLRCKPDAQRETREIMEKVRDLMYVEFGKEQIDDIIKVIYL